jgi:membrane protein
MKKHRFKLKDFWQIIKTTAKEWYDADPFRESAIIAYYAIFSLPALLVIVISLAGFAFGEEAVRGEVSAQISGILGTDSAKQVEDMIAKAGETKSSVWAAILGIATLIFGATGVFAQMQKSLNIIWEVKADPNQKEFLKLLRDRIFSFGLILSIGFLLLISLVITSLLNILSEWLRSRLPEIILYIFFIVEFLISFGFITVLFALMYKILPDVKIRWKYVWIGAIVTSLLFVIGKFLLGLYFGIANPASTYGAASSIVLILLWVSYSCMIVFFGAEFTRQYTTKQGGKIIPTEVAVREPDRTA